jgi:hypothetical protein
LSADGSIVAIGAIGNDGGGSIAGHARVYEWITLTSSWTQKGADIDGGVAGDQSGKSVSLSADGLIVAIGAHKNDGSGNDSGHVRVYEWITLTNTWTQKGADIGGEAAGDESGISVSLSTDGLIVAIGANKNDGSGNDSGHVRVYEWIALTNTWTQKGADIDGANAGDGSGYSVSLSADGLIVAIGADQNDGNGVDAGHVRIYEWITSDWIQKGSDIEGKAVGNRFGFSVSLSADGNIVASGAHKNGPGRAGIYSTILQSNSKAGSAGREKKIKRKLPGTFSFTVGDPGSPGTDGGNTILTTPSGDIIVNGGLGQIRPGPDGDYGQYDGYGAGGGGSYGNGGGVRAGDSTGLLGGSGAPGFVLVTYS